MAMTDKHDTARYPTNWPVKYLCDCKKHGKPVTVHDGVAHDISAKTMHIRGDHHICSGKEVAIILKVPPLAQGGEHVLLKLVGRSLVTVVHDGDFLTEIEFSRFENDGHEILQRHLKHRFDSLFFASLNRDA